MMFITKIMNVQNIFYKKQRNKELIIFYKKYVQTKKYID